MDYKYIFYMSTFKCLREIDIYGLITSPCIKVLPIPTCTTSLKKVFFSLYLLVHLRLSLMYKYIMENKLEKKNLVFG